MIDSRRYMVRFSRKMMAKPATAMAKTGASATHYSALMLPSAMSGL